MRRICSAVPLILRYLPSGKYSPPLCQAPASPCSNAAYTGDVYCQRIGKANSAGSGLRLGRDKRFEGVTPAGSIRGLSVETFLRLSSSLPLGICSYKYILIIIAWFGPNVNMLRGNFCLYIFAAAAGTSRGSGWAGPASSSRPGGGCGPIPAPAAYSSPTALWGARRSLWRRVWRSRARSHAYSP